MTIFEEAQQLYWENGCDFNNAAIQFVQKHPSWKPALWERFFNEPFDRLETWEQMFMDGRLVPFFSDEIKANAVEMAAAMEADGWEDGFRDYGVQLEQLLLMVAPPNP